MSPPLEGTYNDLNSQPRFAHHGFNPSTPGTGVYKPSPPSAAMSLISKARKTPDPLEALRALPEVRQIPWHDGKELPPEKSTQSPRSQTRGAFLLVTRGEIRNPPCSHCATGVGRFSVCVSLDGWFHGACATCQMGTRGNTCSLRKDAEEASSETGRADTEPTQSPPMNETNRPSSSLKRKRRSPSKLADTSVYQQYSTPYAPPANGPQSVYQQSPYTTNTPSYSHPPSNTPNANAMPPVNFIYQKPPNGTYPQQFHLAHSRDLAAGASPNIGGGSHETLGRDGSTSLSPSTQLLQPAQSVPYGAAFRNNGKGASAVHQGVETPLIDTLPRKKQKQIFGIIGGLQSGIKSVRQQADSLQKQLDLLQAALGIDSDEGQNGHEM